MGPSALIRRHEARALVTAWVGAAGCAAYAQDPADLPALLEDVRSLVEEFRFELTGKPRKVGVDPHRNNLAEYR